MKKVLYYTSMNYEILINQLVENNWTTLENFLSDETCDALVKEFNDVKLSKAKVGIGQTRTFRPEIRSDSIAWLDANNATILQKNYLEKMNDLQLAVNRSLYLGLKEFECHLALYQKGEHYSKHTDQFQGNNSRTLTAITYLNTPSSGGELIIYKKNNPDEIDEIIKPKKGLFICFLSDRLYHEVKVTNENRYSLTGWFKNSIG